MRAPLRHSATLTIYDSRFTPPRTSLFVGPENLCPCSSSPGPKSPTQSRRVESPLYQPRVFVLVRRAKVVPPLRAVPYCEFLPQSDPGPEHKLDCATSL